MKSKIADALFWIGMTITIWSAHLHGYDDTVKKLTKTKNEGWAKRY